MGSLTGTISHCPRQRHVTHDGGHEKEELTSSWARTVRGL